MTQSTIVAVGRHVLGLHVFVNILFVVGGPIARNANPQSFRLVHFGQNFLINCGELV